MKNLYVTGLFPLLLLFSSINGYAQLTKTDSCKFYVAAGSSIPPVPGWLDDDNFPFFFEAGYYFNPKTSLGVTVTPYINLVHYDYYINPSDNTDFYVTINLERHPKIFKWLYLQYGGGLSAEYDHFSWGGNSTTAFGIGPGVSAGFEIKLYKNLFFYDCTDFAYAWYFSNNPDYGGYSELIIDHFFSTGLKFRF